GSEDNDPDLSKKGAQAAAGRRCASCHTDSYAGTKAVARLAGQREEYLVKALHDYKTSQRVGGAGAAMADVAYSLSEEEITALAHYLAYLQWFHTPPSSRICACACPGRQPKFSRELPRPLLLVRFQMGIGDAQLWHRHLGGVAPRDEVADDVIGFDRKTCLDVAEHRGRHRRAFGGEQTL